ncbi:SH3 domain-containing [Chlorella sorokiniana]|uniref:SH3 domain-containing n=1 Tax=Chlorella sorokiniana TaxID=3076 RepID=A0A2P6TJH4_CHLSO|nr:SH3 domain-containing [Chlorella sorokiniana]|eukprot:PRW39398.1 SH3 domain-containing [Chlorella sorokiniana]
MGLSGGAIAGIVIGACVAAVLIGLLVLWQMSAQRKRQEEAERMEAGGSAGRQGLQPVPSGKGDRFFSNLMPSFVKR